MRLLYSGKYIVAVDTAVDIIVEASQPYDEAVVFEPERRTLLEKKTALSRSLLAK